MAVSFPRPLLPIAYSECDLMLRRFTSQSASGGRLANIVEYADPLWMVTMNVTSLARDDFRALEGWWDSLREGLRTVLFRDPVYVAPKLNMAARGPETVTGTISAITTRNIVTISGVDPGLALSNQDFISFEQGASRALVRVIDVSGAGASRTVEIEPALPLNFLVGAIARFDRASLLMRPVAQSFEKQKIEIRYTASFQLIESAT